MRTYIYIESSLVIIVGIQILEKFAEKHSTARAACSSWRRLTTAASWTRFEDLRKTFNSTDRYKDKYIFDLAEHYRLIATIDFKTQELFIRKIMHHDEYDRGEWKK